MMNQENNQLFREFEKEVWLFLDRDLPIDRMEFWKNKLKEIPELQNYLDEYYFVAKSYDNIKEIDIDPFRYNEIVNIAISKDSFAIKTKNYIKNIFSTENDFSFGKIAFASVLIIAAIAISILSNRPNPVTNFTNSINSEILEWDADFVDTQISKVGTLLKVAQDEDYRKYYRYKLSTRDVDKNLNHINSNIKSLKEEINSKEL